MDSRSKIYVAGHNGLVGSAIKRALTKKGYTDVIGKSSSELDLRNAAAVDEYFATENPEYVFLAAAKVGGIGANSTYRADFILDNLQIQNNILAASHKHGIKKLVFLGSSCIYPRDATQPIKEESLLTDELEYTNEPYAIAKIAGMKLAESLNLQYGTNYISVMPTNLYGPNDNYDLEKSHVFPAIVRKTILARMLDERRLDEIRADLGLLSAGKQELKETLAKYGIVKNNGPATLTLWGDGSPYREFLHVDDMADACIYLMEEVNFATLANGMKEVKNTHINIGTGSDLTIKDLAYLIKDVVGFVGEIRFDPTKPLGTPRKLLDVSKIHRLGWHHKISLEEGVRRTVEEYGKR